MTEKLSEEEHLDRFSLCSSFHSLIIILLSVKGLRVVWIGFNRSVEF